MTLSYTVIMHPIRIDLGLSMNEYAVAAAIYYLSTNPNSDVPGWCYAEKTKLGKMLGLTEQTIHTILKTLVSAGLVEKNPVTKHLRTTEKWYNSVIVNGFNQTKETLAFEPDQDQNSVAKETLVGLKQLDPVAKETLAEGAKESLGNNNILDNNTEKDNITSPNGEGETLCVESNQVQLSIPDSEEKPMEGELVEEGRRLKPGQNADGSFGEVGINEAMNLLVRLLGHAPNKSKLNRIAISNSFKRYGQEATLERMAVGYAAYRADRFAPKILNYMDLWDNWDALDRYLNLRVFHPT